MKITIRTESKSSTSKDQDAIVALIRLQAAAKTLVKTFEVYKELHTVSTETTEDLKLELAKLELAIDKKQIDANIKTFFTEYKKLKSLVDK